METYTSEGRAILRCRDCKHAGNLAYTTVTTVREFNGRPSYSATIRVAGAARATPVDRRDGTLWTLRRLSVARCGCGGRKGVDVRIVKGTVVPDKSCDGRCMGATGPHCECSCGGENHGAGHGAWSS